MSIINEQNILGNPELATATRPGSDITIADYSFGTISGLYEKIVHEMMGNARGGSWTQPTSYSGEVAQAEVEGEASTEKTGVAGETTQSEPTIYGTQGGATLTENATMKTNLTQVATVIAEETEPVESVVVPTATAVRSEVIVEEGVQGPVASGGQYNGYSADNQYYQNTQANRGGGATTNPQPIENTGLAAVISKDLDPTSAVTSMPDDGDTPQANRGTRRKKPTKKKLPKREKTTGQSAQRNQGSIPSIYRVHKRQGVNPQASRSGGSSSSTSLGDLDEQMNRGS